MCLKWRNDTVGRESRLKASYFNMNGIGRQEPDYKEITDCIGQQLVSKIMVLHK